MFDEARKTYWREKERRYITLVFPNSFEIFSSGKDKSFIFVSQTLAMWFFSGSMSLEN
jgi:hypothetical protein